MKSACQLTNSLVPALSEKTERARDFVEVVQERDLCIDNLLVGPNPLHHRDDVVDRPRVMGV